MKRILSLKVIAVSALVVIAAAGNLAAAQKATQKQKPTHEEEFPFNKVGSVAKHGPDICMTGINYELKSPDGKATDALAASSKADIGLLEKASKDGSWVRVKGTMMIGVENCKWVKVSSVTPIKKK
jgi:hypothetical protein